MNKTKYSVSSDEISQIIVGAMQNKKALDITIIDVRNIQTAVTDYFIICTASSYTHIASISEEVQKEVENIYGETPNNFDKKNNTEWMILDYFNVVVHIFSKEKREFYNLENLWGDGKITEIKNIAQ